MPIATATALIAAAPASLAATVSAVASGSVAVTAPIESFIASTVPAVVASALPSGLTTTAPVTSTVMVVPLALELAAVFTGALFGAFHAVERRFDLVGVLVLAMTGLVGGMVRDVILVKYGVAAFASDTYFVTALAAGLLVFFFASAIRRLDPVMFAVDALSLGLFAVVGADKALFAGLTIVPAILLGAVTSVGGSVARDLLCGESPQILRPGTLYASAAVTGAVIYVLMAAWLDIAKPIASVVAVVVVLALRVIAVRRGWQAPTPTDLTPVLERASRRIGDRVSRKGRGGA